MLVDTLQSIVDHTPGAMGAILMGFDGITVVQAMAEGANVEIEPIAMEFSYHLTELKKAAQARTLGAVTDITIKAERGTLLIRGLTDEYFVCVLFRDPRHLGKGRWVLRSNVERLMADL
jgi:predicted regulator of Ras-like GTPase activity (Roadblock/LC7/MglB family)